jgi:hypothetical protein
MMLSSYRNLEKEQVWHLGTEGYHHRQAMRTRKKKSCKLKRRPRKRRREVRFKRQNKSRYLRKKRKKNPVCPVAN